MAQEGMEEALTHNLNPNILLPKEADQWDFRRVFIVAFCFLIKELFIQ
jgi:hypothetical protein